MRNLRQAQMLPPALALILHCSQAFTFAPHHIHLGQPMAFFKPQYQQQPVSYPKCPASVLQLSAKSDYEDAKLVRVSSKEEDTPIPFVDASTPEGDFIECFADSLAYVNGVEYTIGSPCDTAVALCVTGVAESEDQLTPVELDDGLMDELFPIAEGIVEEEFGEELVLMRTPQTLTLVGELDVDNDDDDMDDEDLSDEEEEVEILLSFEHSDDMEVHLVRLLDPVLLVGKQDPENPLRRLLLTPRESDEIMPILEELFLKAQDGDDVDE